MRARFSYGYLIGYGMIYEGDTVRIKGTDDLYLVQRVWCTDQRRNKFRYALQKKFSENRENLHCDAKPDEIELVSAGPKNRSRQPKPKLIHSQVDQKLM